MSKNSNDQSIVAESKVLTTSLSRTVAKYTALFAAAGLLLGMIVMVILNLGIPEKLHSLVSQVAIEEVVAHNASTEEKDPSLVPQALKKINIKGEDYEIAFPGVDPAYGYHVEYDGNPHTLELLYTDRLPEGVTVSYIDNTHTDAGTYYVTAVLSGAGYEPVVINGDFVIGRKEFSVGSNAIKFNDAIVKYEEGKGHTIEVSGSLPADTKVTYYYNNVLLVHDDNNDNRPVEHGIYYVTAVLENRNYITKTLTATLKIVDLNKLVSFNNVNSDTGAIHLTYNGKEQAINLNIDKIKEVGEFEGKIGKISYIIDKVKDFDGSDSEVADSYGNYFVDAGEYILVAEVSVAGFGTAKASVKVVVSQGDINSIYGVGFDIKDAEDAEDNVNVEYNEKVKGLIIHNLPDHIKYTISTIYRVTGEDENRVYTEISKNDVCNPGDYRFVIQLVDTTGNCKDYSSENENLLTHDFTIIKRDINKDNKFSIADVDPVEYKKNRVNNFVMTLPGVEELPGTILEQGLKVTFTYTHTNRYVDGYTASKFVVFTYTKVEVPAEVPQGAEGTTESEEGVVVEPVYKYVIYYTIDGESKDADGNDYIIEAIDGKYEFVIPFDCVDQGDYTISAVISENDFDAEATITSNMLIKYAKLDGVSVPTKQWTFADGEFHTPKIKGAPKDAIIEFFDKDGNLVEGFKYFGFHDVKVVITSGNYQRTLTTTYKVWFNPLIAIIGMLVGMLLGAIVGAVIGIFSTGKEKASNSHFRGPGAIVANARGGIICESYARCDNNNDCVGRLYLSSQSLEFYAEDYKALKDNFLIDIDDIRNVKAIAPNKIEVYANKETHVFTVPDGTSVEWAELIIHA